MSIESWEKLVNHYTQFALKHPLYSPSKKVVVFRGSNEPNGIVFVGEAPGFDENEQGKPFVGRSGKVLDQWIAHLGLTHFTVLNAVPLIPLDNEGKIRKPTPDEINDFRPFMQQFLAYLKPRVIVIAGKSAGEALGQEVSARVGTLHDHYYLMYHPAYYLRNGQNGVKDLARLQEFLQHAPKRDPTTKMTDWLG